MNQTGEAAGAAACLALTSNTPIPSLNPANVRNTPAENGSVIV